MDHMSGRHVKLGRKQSDDGATRPMEYSHREVFDVQIQRQL